MVATAPTHTTFLPSTQIKNLKYAILTALLFITACSRNDDAANQKICIQQMRKLESLGVEYAASHGGMYPKTFDELLSVQKIPDPTLLISPLAADKSKPSYELIFAGKKLISLPDGLMPIRNPGKTILIRSLYTTKGGYRLAAFADGHIRETKDQPQ